MAQHLPGGNRERSFKAFRIALSRNPGGGFIALLVDSEKVVADVARPWEHLAKYDGWQRPTGASDDQAFLMTTTMETWIAADHAALRRRFGAHFRPNQMPPLHDLESRLREAVREALVRATNRGYQKGKVSFDLLAILNPATLEPLLPSFRRMLVILRAKLGP